MIHRVVMIQRYTIRLVMREILPSMDGREQQHLPVPENLGNFSVQYRKSSNGKNTSKGNEYRGFLHRIGKENRGRRVDIPNYLFGRDNICTYFQYQKRSGKSSVLSFPSFRKIAKYAL